MFEEDLAEMAEIIAESGNPQAILEALASMLGVELFREGTKPEHPILKRRLENLFPDYAKRKEEAIHILNGLKIFNPSQAQLNLIIYLGMSPALHQLQGKRKKPTIAEKVYWQLVEMSDESLQVKDGQTAVSQTLELKQPHVSRAFKKLEALKLLARSGYDQETGVGVWTLLTPTLAE